MLVEHLDKEHFTALFREYASVEDCRTGLELVWGLIGGAPGFLPEVCGGDDSVRVFHRELENSCRERARQYPRHTIQGQAGEPGLDARRLLALADEIMSGAPVRPLEDPLLYGLGQLMTLHNLVYPLYEPGMAAIVYRPQVPVYKHIIGIALERGYTSILQVDPGEVVRRAVESPA